MLATAKLYRYGGDEFAVFLPDADNGILERALRDLEDRKEAYNMETYNTNTTASVLRRARFFKKARTIRFPTSSSGRTAVFTPASGP